MSSESDEESIKSILNLLGTLSATNEDGIVRELDDVFKINFYTMLNSKAYEDLITKFSSDVSSESSNQSIRWRFICACVELIKMLHTILLRATDERVRLLSVKQNKLLQTCIELIISMGLIPSLYPGVNLPLELRCKNWQKFSPEDVDLLQKHKRIAYITEFLLCLSFKNVLEHLVIPKHLTDLLSALLQLSYLPIKKPVSHQDSKGGTGKDGLVITQKMWEHLTSETKTFTRCFNRLLQTFHQPTVIRELMILQTCKDMPKMLKKRISRLILNRLMEKKGIMSAIASICDVEKPFADMLATCESLAALFIVIYKDSPEKYKNYLAPQIVQMLQNNGNEEFNETFCKIALYCIKRMYETEGEVAVMLYIEDMMKPFKVMLPSYSEDYITQCIEDVHTCFAKYSTSVLMLDYTLLTPAIAVLFHIHCTIINGVSHLRTLVKEILCRYFHLLTEDEPYFVPHLCNALMFNTVKPDLGITSVLQQITYGPTGGVVFTENKNGVSISDLSVALAELICEFDTNGVLSRIFFMHLLGEFQFSYPELNETIAEKLLAIFSSMNILMNDAKVLNWLVEKPELTIPCIGHMLDRYEIGWHDDMICACMAFVSLVLKDMMICKGSNWQPFDNLLEPLGKLKSHSNDEIRILAHEIYCLIVTRNVVGKNKTDSEVIPESEVIADSINSKLVISSENNKENLESESSDKKYVKTDKTKYSCLKCSANPSDNCDALNNSECERALHDACYSPLLPVRAHALMELVRLLKIHNQEAKMNRSKIFCLFQMTINDEDSYIYLRAIEGLATLANDYPKETLSMLCSEYAHPSDCHERRLKIGEVLLRIVKNLGDCIHVYKTQLLNTFLSGVRDKDHLVRASSLSNLGEVCKLLKYNLGSITIEILECTRCVIETDKFQEPRRGAVLLISLLLRGLSTTMLQTLGNVMLQLYRSLKHIYSFDKDEMVRLHAQVALEEINANTRHFLNAPIPHKKTIYISDPPPTFSS